MGGDHDMYACGVPGVRQCQEQVSSPARQTNRPRGQKGKNSMCTISSHNRLALLDTRSGIVIRTIETMDELLETVMSFYANDFDLITLRAKSMEILSNFEEEQREDDYQAESGRCYFCNKLLNACDCDE